MKIRLENVTKCYGNSEFSFKAVNNFSYEFPDGSLVAMLGPSGCGKSTCLNMICGLVTPTSGEIYFGDRNVSNVPPEHRGVGMVFQEYALYPHLTVFQNIIFPLQNQRMPKDEMRRRAEAVARLVEIEHLLERKPRALSGGQRQRVAIARALAKNPDVLLLDEPMSNLDARLRLNTREEIRRIQKSTGITTIFVTHDQEEAMSISDQIIVMKDGLIMQTGKPQDVYNDPESLFVAYFLGHPRINVLYNAEIRNGGLYVGEDRLGAVDDGLPDGEVTVCIRPEGLVPDMGGALHCGLDRIEVQGRDVIAVFTHPGFSHGEVGRAIVPDECDLSGEDKVCFAVKPNKLFLFEKGTDLRIRTEFIPANAEHLRYVDDGVRSKD